MKKVIITGVTGQDGSYLAELLLEYGYKVYGFVRKESYEILHKNFRLIKILDKVEFIPISLTNSLDIYKTILKIKPDEVYHLAAKSYVDYDMGNIIEIMDINFYSTLYIVEALKDIPESKLFFAGSSEMFGEPDESPQNELSKFNPKSPYGISKLSSYFLLKNLRKKGLFVSVGILYNHESPRRKDIFVTKKIVSSAVRIKYNIQNCLEIGNLEAKRDWGYAPDYVRGMYLVMQQEKPDDYIFATGRLYSVREFIKKTFDYLGLDYTKYIKVNRNFYRPSEKVPLYGNPIKLEKIGWQRTKDIDDIIKEMIEFEMENNEFRIKNERLNNYNL